MTITHHPDIATLLSCAAGSQPEALAAVVASHLTMCPDCAAEVGRMQEIGIALFDDLEPTAVASAPPTVRARADEAVSEASGASNSEHLAKGDVPPHLVPLIGTSLDAIPWKRIAPGIWHFPVRLSDAASGSLGLVKVAPGRKLPEHGHRGEELTLVLEGSYRDEVGTFAAGDLADLDPDTEHMPIADAATGCICLFASERQARFKGLLTRLLQPFIGI
jgi:putative transcriptional regulator